MNIKKYLFTIVAVVLASVLITLFYKNKLKSDLGIIRLEDLNKEIAITETRKDLLEKDIKGLEAQLKEKKETLSGTTTDLNKFVAERDKLKGAIYHLDQALGRNDSFPNSTGGNN